MGRIEDAARMQAVREALDPWERRENERLARIADIGKAESQPLSPEAIRLKERTPEAKAEYLAQKHAEQLVENARLCQAVQAAEVENQGLRAQCQKLTQMLEAAGNEEERKDWNLWYSMGFECATEKSLYRDKLEYWETWAKRIFGDLLDSMHKYQDGAYASSSTHANSALVFLHRIFCPSEKAPCAETAEILEAAYQEMRILRAVPEPFNPLETKQETPQNPSICPVEPPVVVSGGDSAMQKIRERIVARRAEALKQYREGHPAGASSNVAKYAVLGEVISWVDKEATP